MTKIMGLDEIGRFERKKLSSEYRD